MSETPFTQFIQLIEIDQRINLLTASIKKLEKENIQLQLQEQSLHDSLEKVKAHYHDVHKDVDFQELEMKRFDQQEAAKKAQLDTVSNHKEYSSLKHEIDVLKKKQHALEDELVTLWNNLEIAKKDYEKAQKSTEEKISQLHRQKEANLQQIAQVQREITEKEGMRKEEGIPAEWLEKYKVMRTRITNPVVPAHESSCSACFYKISPADMVALERNKLVQCKDCFRLLYRDQKQSSEQPAHPEK